MTISRQRAVKQKAVNYLGGKCIVCNYDKHIGALEFHHVNPEEKEFSIGQVKLSSFERMRTELDKCVILCANCHREFHGGLIELPPRN
jgi:5-methylcytosine-specific restriction endonuclease McrA